MDTISIILNVATVIQHMSKLCRIYKKKKIFSEKSFEAAKTIFEEIMSLTSQSDDVTASLLEGFQRTFDKLESMELKILTEMKSDDHRRTASELASLSEKFDSIIESYKGQNLIKNLDSFLEEAKAKNFEHNLVFLLTKSTPSSSSLIDNYCASIANVKSSETGSSQQKLLFDLYVFIVFKIEECYNLQLFCIEKRDECTGKISSEDRQYIKNIESSAIKNLNNAFTIIFDKFKSPDASIYHSNLSKELNDNEYRSTTRLHTGRVEVKRPGCVVTGVRFQHRNKIVYIQIQSGKLLPLGLIDPNTVGWEPLPENEESVKFFYVAPCFGSFEEDNVVITGIQITACRPIGKQNGFFRSYWGPMDAEVACLKMIGRKFDFKKGIIDDSVEMTKVLVSNDEHLSYIYANESVVIQENKLLYCYDDSKKLMCEIYFMESDVSLGAPVHAINLMNYNTPRTLYDWGYEKFFLKLYVKSFFYSKLF